MVIIINGKPQSGKDTFVEMCNKFAKPQQLVANVLTSTPMKQALEQLYWNGEKTPEVRNLLSDLKQRSNELFDTTNKYISKRILDIEIDDNACGRPPSVIFVHCREPKEIAELSKRYNALTLFVDRKVELDEGVTNASDLNVENYNYDVTIPNYHDLKHLEKCAEQLMIQVRETHLCCSCARRKDFPNCSAPSSVVFGNGKGFDNVVVCHEYK